MKRIHINKVMVTPPNIEEHCSVFKVTEDVMEWVESNGLNYKKHPKGYLNIKIDYLEYRYKDLFYFDTPYYYFDGFSPNLNKSLHMGHLSNLVYASAISNLCSYLSPVSILNDTDNDKNKGQYYEEYKDFCQLFNYTTDRDYMSSEMDIVRYVKSIKNSDFKDRYVKELEWGQIIEKSFDEDFSGCYVAISPKTNTKSVVKKSDKSTTYFGQDLDFARKLYEPILYLTGAEQTSHFDLLIEYFPKNKHIPIGLITTDKEKMSSRKGNVVYLKELLKEYDVNTLKDTFLKYNTKTFKNNLKIEKTLSSDFKEKATAFENKKLYITYLKAIQTFSPSLLFKSLETESQNDIDFGLKLLGYE